MTPVRSLDRPPTTARRSLAGRLRTVSIVCVGSGVCWCAHHLFRARQPAMRQCAGTQEQATVTSSQCRCEIRRRWPPTEAEAITEALRRCLLAFEYYSQRSTRLEK